MDQPKEEKFTEEELRVISSTLGVEFLLAKSSNKKKDKKLPKEFYRNYFCLQDIESYEKGNFREPYYTLFLNLTLNKYADYFKKFGNVVYYITDKGIEKFKSEFNEIVNK